MLLTQLRAKTIVMATGAIERPLVFSNNDRPGVMLASALRTYANRFAVAPDKRAVIVANNDTAYSAALDLADLASAAGDADGAARSTARAARALDGTRALVDPRRFGPYASRGYLKLKNEEAYAKVFTVHYPDEEREAGRALRRTPCYDRMKALGVNLSIDDFGTGYSSLSHLHRLPISELKLDQSFVRDIDTSAIARTLTSSVLRIGESLGMKVVAEGVETHQEEDMLRRQGCDEIQGYLYSRPLSPRDLALWLRQQHAAPEVALAR